MSYSNLSDDELIAESHRLQAAKEEIRDQQRQVNAERSSRAAQAAEGLTDTQADVAVKAATAKAGGRSRKGKVS